MAAIDDDFCFGKKGERGAEVRKSRQILDVFEDSSRRRTAVFARGENIMINSGEL
jgi:hypothetical protein